MQIIPIFVGFDPREEVGTHAFNASLLAHTTHPFAIIPLSKKQLDKHLGEHFQTGTNDFTVTRFLVPWLMDFHGPALFVDGADMIAAGDISELFKQYDPMVAVKVVKHEYQTKHKRKYVGSKMETDNIDYERKQWASVMLFSCGHPDWRKFTPEYVAKQKKIDLLQFNGINSIGELSADWNWLCQEYGPNEDAKIIHYTAGSPAMRHYANSSMASDFHAAHAKANYVSD